MEDLADRVKAMGKSFHPVSAEEEYQILLKSKVPLKLKPMSGRIYWKTAGEGETPDVLPSTFSEYKRQLIKGSDKPEPIGKKPLYVRGKQLAKPRPKPVDDFPVLPPQLPLTPAQKIVRDRREYGIAVTNLPECEQFVHNALEAAELFLKTQEKKDMFIVRFSEEMSMESSDSHYLKKLDDTTRLAEKLFNQSLERYALCACKVVKK